MPISTHGYEALGPGLKWNRATGTAIFDVRGANQQRFRKVLKFVSDDAARAAFEAFRRHVAEPGADAPPRPAPVAAALTFERFCDLEASAVWCDAEASTIKQNLYALKRYVLPHFGSLAVADIGDSQIRAFKAGMRTHSPRPFSPVTINFALRRLREVLAHAKRLKVLTEIPPIRMLPEEELRNEMTPEEQASFLAAFDDEAGFRLHISQHRSTGTISTLGHLEDPFNGKRRHGTGPRADSDATLRHFERFRASKPWFVAALHTGLRKGDLLNLRKSAVRLREGFIIVTMRKTGRAARIPISSTLKVVLEPLLQRTESDYLFVTPDNQPYAESVIRRYFTIAKAIACIRRRLRINDLRHTFASNLASAGLSTLVIRDCLGHTTTKQSERYARPDLRVSEAVRIALENAATPLDAGDQ